MAGENSGGEFFEVIQNDQDLFFIQVGSDSYLLSSMILSEIEILKEKSISMNLQHEILQFQNIINHHALENKSELTYCMMNLNLKTFQATFALKGRGHIFFREELISFESPIKLQLKPRERLCILSQGSMRNWEMLNDKLFSKTFFIDNLNLDTSDLINEFFFQVSRNKAGNFLIYDALMAILEIDENALYQLS
jgi:hypothetical protein